MKPEQVKIFQARNVAQEVENNLADLLVIDGKFFDGKHIIFRIRQLNVNNEDIIVDRIRKSGFEPTTYSENGYFFVYFPLKKRRTDRPPWVMNVIFFLVTVGTTSITGMFYGSPGSNVWQSGFYFAGSLLFILGAHEFGHYFLARFHRIKATLPYFIPAPPFPITPIGTFGAFIQMKSPIPNRVALFDVGIAGPLSGFIAALPILVFGLKYSTVVHIAQIGAGGFILGDSLLFNGLALLFGPKIGAGMDINLHPAAFAGWVGLLVTAINLLPIGQLDGGHIIYALFPKYHRYIARIFFYILVGIGFFLYNGWLLWAVLILFLIRLDHPPSQDDHIRLDTSRKILGYLAIVLLIMTFTPAPIEISY